MAFQSREDEYKEILRSLEDELIQSISIDSLLPSVFAKNLVSYTERDQIQTTNCNSPRDACSQLTAALRRLPKGMETVNIFYRILLKVGGHDNLAEKIRKAFSDRHIDITEKPVESLHPSQHVSKERPYLTAPTDTPSLPTPTVATDLGEYPYRRERLLHNKLSREDTPTIPSPPDSVCLPSNVYDLNREFSRLLVSTYNVVSSLSGSKLRSLRKLLSGLLRENCFGKAKTLSADPDELADLVTSEDQDFVNYIILKESIEMLADEKLSSMLEDYEIKLTAHKEKCLDDSLQMRRPLIRDDGLIIVRMGHQDKSREEFQLSHVIQERSFLMDVTGIARVHFQGFTSGSVYLYFSMPKDSVFLLLPALKDNLQILRRWGVTDVIVYDYFSFDLIQGSFVSWRAEIDRNLKSEADKMSQLAENATISSKMKKLAMSQEKKHESHTVGAMASTNKELRAEIKQLKQNLEKVEKTKSKEIEHLKHRIQELESKLKTEDKNEETHEELPPKA